MSRWRPRFRARVNPHLGPFFFRFTQRGFSSWGIRVGPWTRNFTRNTTTLDTPGPGSLHWRGRGQSRRD